MNIFKSALLAAYTAHVQLLTVAYSATLLCVYVRVHTCVCPCVCVCVHVCTVCTVYLAVNAAFTAGAGYSHIAHRAGH